MRLVIASDAQQAKQSPTKLEIASSGFRCYHTSTLLAMTIRYFHGAVMRTLVSSAA